MWINASLGELKRWRTERVQLSRHAAASSPLAEARVCERVVVFSKRDLVPEWGIEVWIFIYLPTVQCDCSRLHAWERSRSRGPWPQKYLTRGQFLCQGTGRRISRHSAACL
jgi:hypothetical protein